MNSLQGLKKYGFRMLKTKIRINNIARQTNFRTDYWSAIKRSKTIFILGSGSSINEYTNNEWSEIQSHTSIGLNYWTLHDFIPDAYCFETATTTLPLVNNLAKKKIDYKNTSILIKDIDNTSTYTLNKFINNYPKELQKNTYLSLDFDYPTQTPEDLTVLLHILKKYHFFNYKHLPVPRKIGSIFYLISLLSRLRPLRIILCGVDLNNPQCFFDPSRDKLINNGFSLPPIIDGTHQTIDPSKLTITIDSALFQLNDIALKPLGIELYVAKSSSSLYPSLPEYFQ